jgi:sugar phosphate isomerase/epimerase
VLQSAITISLVPQARGGPFVFWDDLAAGCEAASTLGFDAVEIFPPSPAAVNPATLKELLMKYNLKVAAFGTGGGWLVNRWHLTHPDAKIRQQAREFIRGMLDLAVEFKAGAILGSMQGKFEGEVTREQALAWLAEALQDLGVHALKQGTVLFYEPLNRYETNLLNRQGDAVSFLEQHRIQGVKLLCDLYHMNIEEADLAATLRAAGKHVGHIHFADSNRQAMGWGHTSAAPIIKALKEIGYTGYLSGEILPLPNSLAAAKQTMEAFRHHAR